MSRTVTIPCIVEPAVGELMVLEHRTPLLVVVKSVEAVERYDPPRLVTYEDKDGARVVGHSGLYRITLEPAPD